MITLPTGFVSDISTNASSLISSLSPFVTLVLGVLLATVVLSILIKSLTKH